MKQREIITLIKSGLVGAFTLAGLFMISVIAFADSHAFSSLIEETFKIVPSLWEVFAIVGGVGFMLGLVLRRCFPVIQNGMMPLVIAFLLSALPLGFFAWVFFKTAMNLEPPPQSLKLADCTGGAVNFRLHIPAVRDYQLELKTPALAASSGRNESNSYVFSGRLRILNGGALLADLSISSGKTWLAPDGYTVTGIGLQNTNASPLSNLVQSGMDYGCEMTLNPPPPTNASIWLYWREPRISK